MNTTRSLIRSQWEKLTFYGPKPKNDGYMEVDGISELSETPPPVQDEPTVQDEPPMPKVFDDEPELVLEGRKWKARGKLTCEGFVVYAGSTAKDIPPSFKADKTYFPIRQALMDDGTISQEGVFTREHIFRSATQAGCVIAADGAIQAKKKWHTEPDEDGVTMTYEECHPKSRGAEKREKEARGRRREVAKQAKERLDRIVRTSDAVIDGRAWRHEWRGQCPIREEGIYLGAAFA